MRNDYRWFADVGLITSGRLVMRVCKCLLGRERKDGQAKRAEDWRADDKQIKERSTKGQGTTRQV